MIFLQLSIGKFGSSLCPVSWRESRMNLVGPSRNIICFIHFLLVGDFSFIKGCRKHEWCTRFKINRVSFYSPFGIYSELNIRYSNKGLWIRASLHMLTRFRRTHRPTLMFKECLCLTFTFRVSGTCGSDETSKIVLLFSLVCLSFFWKVPLDIFTQDKRHTEKRKTLS